MTDNIDVFERIIFHIPGFKKVLMGIIGLGVIYSGLSWLSIYLFAGTEFDLVPAAFAGVLVFIVPALLSGEMLRYFLPDYPRNWGYFLAASNQLILFVFALILSGADNLANAWSIFWISLISIYLSNLLVLLLTLGKEYLYRLILLSLVQPASVFTVFYVFIGSVAEISPYVYLQNFVFVFFAAAAIFSAFLMSEYLLKANLASVSALDLVSGLLQKRQEALDLGYPTRVDVQNLKITNEKSELDLAIPWVHPGPLEGFGGGEITTKIIEALNKGKNEGFFLHVPSTHKSDPADPEDYSKILKALGSPETNSKASKLIKKTYGAVTFYGRKVGDKKIVFMDAEIYSDGYLRDDYEIGIFKDVIDPNQTVVVDLHNHEDEEDKRREMYNNTDLSRELRSKFKDFVRELEEEEVHDYSAGFEVDSENATMSLVEQVEGQKTLILGVEDNGIPSSLREAQEKMGDNFEEVVLFSTDTHNSIHEMSSPNSLNTEDIVELVEESISSLSEARVGFESSRTEPINLLKDDYSGLIFSINILIRLIPLVLILLYLSLVIWIW